MKFIFQKKNEKFVELKDTPHSEYAFVTKIEQES